MRLDLAKLVSEADWQITVIDMAHTFGWLVHHSRPAYNRSGKMSTPIQGDAGLPDLILVRPPRIIFAELKRVTGRVSPTQQRWLDSLVPCPGVEVYLWTPADADQVEELLRRG